MVGATVVGVTTVAGTLVGLGLPAPVVAAGRVGVVEPVWPVCASFTPHAAVVSAMTSVTARSVRRFIAGPVSTIEELDSWTCGLSSGLIILTMAT
jgi:hypothetical protein